MPSRSIIRTGVGPHREPRNRFPAMAAAINLLAARAARVQSRRNLSRSLSPKLDHSHSITRFDRSRTGPKHRRTEALHPVIGNTLVVVKIASGDLRRGSTSGSLGCCVRYGAAKHEPAARIFKKGPPERPLAASSAPTYERTRRPP